MSAWAGLPKGLGPPVGSTVPQGWGAGLEGSRSTRSPIQGSGTTVPLSVAVDTPSPSSLAPADLPWPCPACSLVAMRGYSE